MRTESFFRDAVSKHAVMQAERLVAFLNEPGTQLESWRGMQVFEDCQELDTHPPEAQIAALMHSINAHLETFQIIPVLGGRNPIHVWWRQAPDTRFREPEAVPAFQLDILRLILDMTEAGTIGRIRKCICGKWFFAQSNKKQVCSDACRFDKYQKLRSEDPAAKKKHADDVKKWRHDPYVQKRKQNGKAKTRKR